MENTSIAPRFMSLNFLKEITNGFSEDRKVGAGSFGSVYKGEQENGETIAVKVLHYIPGLGDEEFEKEYLNLASLQHKNVVRLVGYCHETQREAVMFNGKTVFADNTSRALCFEYMQNGGLDKYLSDEFSGHDWHQRYAIIKGICQGLKYLHEELQPPMYHLDLKPGNVLLDEDMVPRLADFGLSRLFGREKTQMTKSAIGTIGYVPPEYIDAGIISDKFDIFSLGVVIIKIMTGPTGYSRSHEMPSHDFIELVHANWTKRLHEGSVDMMDSDSEQVKRCIKIALSCVKADRRERPAIGLIISKLNETESLVQCPNKDIGSSMYKRFRQVLSLDVHPSDPWIMTSHHDGQIRIWNYETQATEKSFDVTEKPVCTAKFIARKDWLVAGDHAGFMYVYNYNTMHKVVSYRAGGTHITSVAIHPTQPYVLSSSNDHLVKLWDWEKGWQCTQTFEGHTDIVWQVAFNPMDSNSFASVSDDGHLKIWSICSTNRKSYKHSLDLLSVHYYTCRGQQYLITGSFDDNAYVWDLQTDECVQTLTGHTSPVSAICSPEDIPILFTGSYDGTVRQWNSTRTNTFRLNDVLLNHGIGKVHALLCLKGSTRVVIGREDGLSLIEIDHE